MFQISLHTYILLDCLSLQDKTPGNKCQKSMKLESISLWKEPAPVTKTQLWSSDICWQGSRGLSEGEQSTTEPG